MDAELEVLLGVLDDIQVRPPIVITHASFGSIKAPKVLLLPP